MKRVIVHIDRLVLRGIERTDAVGMSGSLEAELRSLLRGGDAVRALALQHDLQVVRAEPASVPHGADAVSLGRAVATRIVPAGAKP